MRGSLAAPLVRRVATALVVVLLVPAVVFVLLELAPGDPARLLLAPGIGAEQQEALRRVWGLDRPPGERYLGWLRSVALDGDWGVSLTRNRPVASVLAAHLGPTALLAVAALLVQASVGLGLGMAAARRARTAADHLLRATSVLLYSLPSFWLGLMALALLSYRWRLFPAGQMRSLDAAGLSPVAATLDLLHHLALPALVLGLAAGGATARFVRNGMLDALSEEHIRAARARGLTPRRILWRHALRQAATPLVQIAGLSLPFLLSGALIVEVIFGWPGVGRLTYEAVLARDTPVVLATTCLTGALVVAGSLLADLLQAALDPRTRDAG